MWPRVELQVGVGKGLERWPKMFEERERGTAGDAPPAAKRKRVSNDACEQDGPEKSLHERKVALTACEFPASSLDDFYKPCPHYRLPVELGAFSFDRHGVFCHDRSQRRYFHPPSHPPKFVIDLKVGYDSFKPKNNDPPSLEPILRWISLNGHCFRPRLEPLSPSKNGNVSRDAPVQSPTLGER